MVMLMDNIIRKKIILPSHFINSPRYMIQNYQNDITIYKWLRHLDLFIIFIYNAQWSEILIILNLIFNQRTEDRSNIVSKIFKIKTKILISDIVKR